MAPDFLLPRAHKAGNVGQPASQVSLDRMTVPAILVAPDGLVLDASETGWPFAEAFVGGAAPALLDAVNADMDAGVGGVHQGVLAMPEGDAPVELLVVPMAGGLTLVVARDSALDHSLREVLVESRQRYKDLVEASSDFAWEVDAQGAFAFVSPAGALGWSAQDLVGHKPEDFIVDPADPGSSEAPGLSEGGNSAHPFSARRGMDDIEIWFRRADGEAACLLACAKPLKDAEGNWCGARGVCRDITEDRERDTALARAQNRERLLGYVIRTIRDEVDPLNMLSAAAAAIARAFTTTGVAICRQGEGGPEQAACNGSVPETADVAIQQAAKREGPVVTDTSGGHVLAIGTRYGGMVNGVLFILRDHALGIWTEDDRQLAAEVAGHIGIAIEQIVAHERLQEFSNTDALTGVLNRRSFLDQLSRRCARVDAGGESGALVYCDLDNFKQVNDTHGHERGDAAIQELAKILTGATRGADLVARLGGDEFALWLENTDIAAAEVRAEDLLARMAPLGAYSGSDDARLGMSLGIAVMQPGSGETLEQLMARADEAMYASKRGGKNRCTIDGSGSEALPPKEFAE